VICFWSSNHLIDTIFKTLRYHVFNDALTLDWSLMGERVARSELFHCIPVINIFHYYRFFTTMFPFQFKEAPQPDHRPRDFLGKY